MQKLKKVAIGGISKECGTYSPLFQTEDDFEMIQGTRLVDLGIELKDFRLLVVKSGYLSPELQSLLSPSFLILSQ